MRDPSADLAGLRILVVEDEVLIAMMIEQMLDELGCEVVGTIPTVEAAMVAVQQDALDGVVADSNLNGKSVRPVIEALVARAVPFVLVTGYDKSDLRGLPLADVSVLKKPFRIEQLCDAIRRSFALSPC